MARVEFSEAAAGDLEQLIVTHSLPPEAKERVKVSLRSVERLPRLGVLLEAPGWQGFRFVLGPWRWLVIVYEYLDDEDRVVIATLQDGRSSIAATASR